VVRAWGQHYRSQRIDHGLVHTFDELRERVLNAAYRWGDPERPALRVRLLGIDSGGGASLSGSRTHEVYRFAVSDTARIRAMKGESHTRDVPIRTKRITYRPQPGRGDRLPVFLTLLDTGHFKDRLAHAISARLADDVPQWELNTDNDADYNRQMSSEQKVLIRKAGGRQVERWVPISSGAANHYWDCEAMQFALADMARVDLLQAPAPRREPLHFTSPSWADGLRSLT
jgi:phage terminase large subunit GpA-like protein